MTWAGPYSEWVYSNKIVDPIRYMPSIDNT